MRRTTPRSRGLSLFETAVSTSILGTIILVTASVLAATSGVARRSHANLMAAESNRQALEHTADVLRSAATDTLTGFDADGVSTSLQFRQVLGLADGALSLGSERTLQWQAGQACAGVANPGDIVIVADGVTTRVAKRVASGGFTVTRSGNALLLHLVTYSPVDGGGVSYATGDATVAVRN